MAKRTSETKEARVTLKTLAEHLHLTAGTISAALNDSAAARAIPEHTKRRILDAARELNYKPNYFARSLRLQRTYTIGVIAQQIGDPYGAAIISGIEEYLRDSEYFFLTVIHRHDQKVLQTYSQMLMSRGVEGFITVDTSIKETPALPTVAVAGHRHVPGVTNITIDHKVAARLALTHLLEHGHQRDRISQRAEGQLGFQNTLDGHLRGGEGTRSARAAGADRANRNRSPNPGAWISCRKKITRAQ